jgi:hypothetical protein
MRVPAQMYLVLGSLDPSYFTVPERSFAIVAYIFVVIIDGAVAGVLSSIMIQIGGMDREVHDKIKATKTWMREQRIPKSQQTEVYAQ